MSLLGMALIACSVYLAVRETFPCCAVYQRRHDDSMCKLLDGKMVATWLEIYQFNLSFRLLAKLTSRMQLEVYLSDSSHCIQEPGSGVSSHSSMHNALHIQPFHFEQLRQASQKHLSQPASQSWSACACI